MKSMLEEEDKQNKHDLYCGNWEGKEENEKEHRKQ